jgi:DNA N-6-adenine-methyltransferase (Dam)
MTDALPLDTLAGAEAAFKAAAARLEDNTATPDVVSRVENIIVNATRQHAGWGKLTIDALLVLGLYLLRNPYRGMGKGGRPPKTVRADSLPTLAERGIKNRRIASRALAVARISEADWNAYKASGGTSESGLHEFVERRELERDENYSESEAANLAPFDPDFGEARSRRLPRGGYLGLARTGSVEWYAPSIIFEALGCRFDLDVASPGAEVVWWIPADRHFTIKENGLEHDWGDAFVWMSHPYSPEMTPLWTEKFCQHGNGICLVGDRTSLGWWQDLCGNADLVLFVNKKIL